MSAVFNDLLLKSDITGALQTVPKAEKVTSEEEKERARRFTLGKPLHKVSIDEKPEDPREMPGIHSYTFN